MADYLVKKASAETSDQLAAMGITGIPADWPVESYPYTGQDIPDGFTQMSDDDIATLKANNQASYDSWLYAKRPIVQAEPLPVSISFQPAFASKAIGTKGLFKRITGIQQSLAQGSNTILFVMQYNWAKINGLEVIGGEANDSVSLYVLDSTTGTYTGHANYQLNQFGFNVNLAKDYYAYKSEFDADLYLNMQIKIVYNSTSAKTIGINFILNEVK